MKDVYHITETTGWTIFYLLILFGTLTLIFLGVHNLIHSN